MTARTRFFHKVEEGLKRKTQTLQDENARLRAELRTAHDAQEAAESRADDNVLDQDDLLDFLMRDERGRCKLEFDVTEERQMRPKEHRPRDDIPCGPDTDLDSAMEADAKKRVPDGLLWDDLRQDVRSLMLTGLTYEEALKLLRGDEPIHHLLPGYMVQLMLAQMMDWGTLDFTSWSKYVPESNYLDAERIWIVDGRGLEKWPSLDKCYRKLQKLKDVAAEVEMINGAFSESSDDEIQVPSFSLKPGAEEADNALEVRDETEDLDDGADEVPTNANDAGPKTASQASSETRRPSPTSGKKLKATSRTPDTKVTKRVKTNTGRAKGARHPTDLAIRDFQSLSEDELLIIEVCHRDVTSTFRIFGIKMRFSDKVQTLGFPYYEPHKHETKYLKDRWSMEAWDGFLGVVRVKKSGTKGHRETTSRRNSSEASAYGSQFYFHRVRDRSKGVLRGIREYLESKEEHAEGWWYILHWSTISMEDDRAKELHLWCRKCRETLVRNFLILVQRLEKLEKFPKTLWSEPGFSWNWTNENLRVHSGQMLRVKLRVWHTYQRHSNSNSTVEVLGVSGPDVPEQASVGGAVKFESPAVDGTSEKSQLGHDVIEVDALEEKAIPGETPTIKLEGPLSTVKDEAASDVLVPNVEAASRMQVPSSTQETVGLIAVDDAGASENSVSPNLVKLYVDDQVRRWEQVSLEFVMSPMIDLRMPSQPEWCSPLKEVSPNLKVAWVPKSLKLSSLPAGMVFAAQGGVAQPKSSLGAQVTQGVLAVVDISEAHPQTKVKPERRLPEPSSINAVDQAFQAIQMLAARPGVVKSVTIPIVEAPTASVQVPTGPAEAVPNEATTYEVVRALKAAETQFEERWQRREAEDEKTKESWATNLQKSLNDQWESVMSAQMQHLQEEITSLKEARNQDQKANRRIAKTSGSRVKSRQTEAKSTGVARSEDKEPPKKELRKKPSRQDEEPSGPSLSGESSEEDDIPSDSDGLKDRENWEAALWSVPVNED
ncbi:hypothetical protein PHMEG_00015442 [Phytophthora megakarya]|uniref:Uncharacterized protein n=1 Tax=Phytophthora megakarya TaxID=4795 RepID=A0A225W2A0_9STRA|nr:hypothetical protein PHMEG_00015442 [Phytophthora megakarya]